MDVSRDHIRPVFATGPQPPSSLFFLKVASSHCHIASKNITKKKHKKKTKNNKKNNTCKDTLCIWGGGAAPSPPTPLQPFFFKGCPLSLPHCFQEHHEEKTEEEDKKRQKITKKQHMQRHPMHLAGRRCALPPNPPPAFFFKVASTHCHIASKNITKKKHKKKTKNNKKKQHMQRHPMHLAGRRCALPTKNCRKKHKCKDAQCIFRRTLQKETTNAKTPDASGGEAPLTHTSRRK